MTGMQTHRWTTNSAEIGVTAGTDGGDDNGCQSMVRLDYRFSNQLVVRVNGGEPVELRTLELGIKGVLEREGMVEAMKYALSILDISEADLEDLSPMFERAAANEL